MKFKINRDAIIDGLQKVQAIVAPRNTIPVLSNVLLKAENNKLWLTTTDLEVSVRVAVEADVSSEGAITIPVKRAFNIFRELPDQPITIELGDRAATEISCGSAFFKLVGISEDEFPVLPSFDEERTYTLSQGVFRDMLQKTGYAASTEETRYVLNGVLLKFKGDKLTVVATDGRRLATMEQEVEFPEDSEAELIVPSKTVNELVRTLGEEGELKIQATGKQVAFFFNEMLVVSKLIEGTYPNFKQVIPPQGENRIAVEREGFLSAVRRVALISSEQTHSVKLTFSKNRLEISAAAADVGEARELLPIKYDKNEINVAFNPEFLVEPLRNIASDEVFIELTDDLSPAVIKTNVPFLYVLMPLRMS